MVLMTDWVKNHLPKSAMITMITNKSLKFFILVVVVLKTIGMYSQGKPVLERFLTVKPNSASFGAGGGTKTFTVNSSGSWKITSAMKPWVHISKNGNALELRVDENTGVSPRLCSIELISGEKSVSIPIKQEGDRPLSISANKIVFNSSGGTKAITVQTNDTWQISSNTNSWIRVSKHGNQLSLSAKENNSTSQRSGTIVIKAGNKEKAVNISQRGNQLNLSVSSDELKFDSYGGTKTITVTSNSTWQIGKNVASWAHLTKNGNQLTIKVDCNTNASSRTDWLSIRMGSKEKRINVSQTGSSLNFSVSSENLNFGSSGGNQTIVVTTNGNWEIGTNTASWAHLTTSGNQIYVKVDQYSGTAYRSDSFSVKVGNQEKRIHILQEGIRPTLSVSSDKLNFSSDGGLQTIFVNSNMEWSLSLGTALWVHLSKDGNKLSVRVNRNKNKTSRAYYFILKSGDKKVVVHIYQNAKYYKSFNHKVDNYIGGISAGYIKKQWEYSMDGKMRETMGVFGDDKYLQGIQAGIRIDPQFGAGFGINTGLFYEYCWADGKKYQNRKRGSEFSYKEHGLYLPLHLKFTMNFSKYFQMSVYGGAGINYVMSGKLNVDDGRYSYEKNVFQEENSGWTRVNTMVEYGASLRIKAVQFDLTLSRGLTDWPEKNGCEVKQSRPLSLSTTICF